MELERAFSYSHLTQSQRTVHLISTKIMSINVGTESHDTCQFLTPVVVGFDSFIGREEKGTSVYRGEGTSMYVEPSLPAIVELIIYIH